MGATLTSEGIRRYPPRSVIEDSLISAGFELTDVRGAPERPGLELVFIARKPATTSFSCPLGEPGVGGPFADAGQDPADGFCPAGRGARGDQRVQHLQARGAEPDVSRGEILLAPGRITWRGTEPVPCAGPDESTDSSRSRLPLSRSRSIPRKPMPSNTRRQWRRRGSGSRLHRTERRLRAPPEGSEVPRLTEAALCGYRAFSSEFDHGSRITCRRMAWLPGASGRPARMRQPGLPCR